ncbi:cysteine hydrolase family protein [Nocardioides sp.]|uniref:cysteine hydrolase family protein n=1 Tax=Nocardioides sp. TaxID=35761 RepID=UPI003D109116
MSASARSPAALVAIGFNSAWVAPDSLFARRLRSSFHDSSYFEDRAAAILPKVNALAAAVRGTAGTVVWVTPELRTGTASDWPISHRASLLDQGFDEPCHDGLDTYALAPSIVDHPRDHRLSTFSMSAFWGGPLLATLRNLGVTDVLVAGCLTQSAVVISAMDSTNTGFLTAVVDDACADVSQERHDESLSLHSRMFRLTGTSEVISSLAEEIRA